jgi:Uma2 family endonuclease
MATMTAGSPSQDRMTASEYLRMGESGVLDEDARVELIDGQLVDMAPIGARHAATVERLAELLRSSLGRRAMVRTQQPSVVGEHSVLQPDIAVVPWRDDFYVHAHPGPRDVLLVVEVAESGLAFDRDVKTAMYARSGVAEVWVVDVGGERIFRSALPREGAYSETVVLGLGDSISMGALPGVVIELHAVFPR